MATKYQKRILGLLLELIDIHIEVPLVDYERLRGERMGETSEFIRTRVQAARNIQLASFANNESSHIVANADMRIERVRQFYMLRNEGESLIHGVMSRVRIGI